MLLLIAIPYAEIYWSNKSWDDWTLYASIIGSSCGVISVMLCNYKSRWYIIPGFIATIWLMFYGFNQGWYITFFGQIMFGVIGIVQLLTWGRLKADVGTFTAEGLDNTQIQKGVILFTGSVILLIALAFVLNMFNDLVSFNNTNVCWLKVSKFLMVNFLPLDGNLHVI